MVSTETNNETQSNISSIWPEKFADPKVHYFMFTAVSPVDLEPYKIALEPHYNTDFEVHKNQCYNRVVL